MAKKENAVEKKTETAAPVTAITKPEENMSERFANKVLTEFGTTNIGDFDVSEYQRKLIQGYFLGIDRSLKIAEEARLRKNANNKDHKYDNTLPVSWSTVNLNDLARDVMHFTKMGLDILSDNHIHAVPYKNNKTQKYDITLMPGYNGLHYIAAKYALDPPDSVDIELVYETDNFSVRKKDHSNSIEGYSFSVKNPFDRGEIIGGFIYYHYKDMKKNRIVVMSMADIEKRKPQYASIEFWGGKKIEWVDGKKTEVEVEGWRAEMCMKTLKREAYSAKQLPRDPKKIDDSYQNMKMIEIRTAAFEAEMEIDENANQTIIDITPDPAPLGIETPRVNENVDEDGVIDDSDVDDDADADEGAQTGMNF